MDSKSYNAQLHVPLFYPLLLNINNIIIYTLFVINNPEGATKTLNTKDKNSIHIYLALPHISSGFLCSPFSIRRAGHLNTLEEESIAGENHNRFHNLKIKSS